MVYFVPALSLDVNRGIWKGFAIKFARQQGLERGGLLSISHADKALPGVNLCTDLELQIRVKLGQRDALSLMISVCCNTCCWSHQVEKQRLHRLAQSSELNDGAYIDETAPCLRQASLQFVIAQEHSGQLHQHACVSKDTASEVAVQAPMVISRIEPECKASTTSLASHLSNAALYARCRLKHYGLGNIMD